MKLKKMDEEEVSGPSGVGCRPGECFHGSYVWRLSNLSVCTGALYGL